MAVLVTAAGLISFAFTGLGTASHSSFEFLQNVELRTLDARFALRGERPHDDRIVIVDVDEKTLQGIGAFPLPRSAYAHLINRLSTGPASVVAFDFTFPGPESNAAKPALQRLQQDLHFPPGSRAARRILDLEVASDQDAQFATALKQSGNIVLGHIFLDHERGLQADPKLAEAYFNIVWAKAFPQVLKVKPRDGHDFDMSQAWISNGGTVATDVEANIPQLAEAAGSYGFLDINPDPDGTLRHALLILRYQDQDFFPSLAVQCVRDYEKLPDSDVAAYISATGLERIQLGARSLQPSRDGSALINYVGPYRTYTHYSMLDVLQGSIPASAFHDKIVLVGGTAKGLGDIRNTPFQGIGSPYMGVEVHANIIDNLLHRDEPHRTFLTRGVMEEATDAGFILLFGLGFGVMFGRLQPRDSSISLLLALVIFAVAVYLSFSYYGRWLGVVVPAGTLVLNYAALTSYRMIFEEREKRRIRKTFSQYLSPDVITLIERDPERYIRPGGEEKELSVLFSDIRGFTSISEGLSPDELVRLLNEYLGEMTEVLFRHSGTLDKYIGDAVMAFWGSPYPQADHALRACRCALEMQARLVVLNQKWRGEGRPPLTIGVGINTGMVNVGNMGSAHRLAWTVMGDNVNLASRLEGITKQYHAGIIISDATYQQVHEEFVCRELDKIRVIGRGVPVTLYELRGCHGDKSAEDAIVVEYSHAMEAYLNQDWREATTRFSQLLTKYPGDGPSQILWKRCKEFGENPPKPDWDGVYQMSSK